MLIFTSIKKSTSPKSDVSVPFYLKIVAFPEALKRDFHLCIIDWPKSSQEIQDGQENKAFKAPHQRIQQNWIPLGRAGNGY